MKKYFKDKSSSIPPQVEPNIAVLINKIQQQLISLEQKIDVLINQSSKRPFEGKHFPKPSQYFDHSYGYNKRKQDNNSRERNFTKVICSDCKKECEVPFRPSGDRPVYCRDCFSKRKDDTSFKGKHDNRPREGNFVQRHHFDKHQDREGQKPSERKKPIFRRRKERT